MIPKCQSVSAMISHDSRSSYSNHKQKSSEGFQEILDKEDKRLHEQRMECQESKP